MSKATLYGLPAEVFQALRGFVPMADGLERAELWLSEGFAVGDREAGAALSVLEALEELLIEEGPRGDGARFALESIGAGRLRELKVRAEEILARADWEQAEASAVTGGLREEMEAG